MKQVIDFARMNSLQTVAQMRADTGLDETELLERKGILDGVILSKE